MNTTQLQALERAYRLMARGQVEEQLGNIPPDGGKISRADLGQMLAMAFYHGVAAGVFHPVNLPGGPARLTFDLIPASQLPDTDETVLLVIPKWSEGLALGWWDGEEWRDHSAATIQPSQWPTHYARLDEKLTAQMEALKGGAR